MFKKWDSKDKLHHVHFYLEDTVKTWFENQELMFQTNMGSPSILVFEHLCEVIYKESVILVQSSETQSLRAKNGMPGWWPNGKHRHTAENIANNPVYFQMQPV